MLADFEIGSFFHQNGSENLKKISTREELVEGVRPASVEMYHLMRLLVHQGEGYLDAEKTQVVNVKNNII